LTLPNIHPERAPGHPHRRRLPRHARHIIRQMLKPRAAVRASVLQTHAKQLDSAVNLRDYPDRVHPDSGRHAPGVRVAIGPETRSLLRQLLESRDLRVQQQLVREIIHQVQKRTIAALKRVKAVERSLARAGKIARGARRQGGRLADWFGSLPARTRARLGGRVTRTVGNRKPAARTRARTGTAPARTRARTGTAPARTREPADRATRPRATRE
jgi:hypothetical protein